MNETAVRLLLAVGFGAPVGLNRDLHKKDAGLRTHALVALGAALVVIAAERLPGAPEDRAAAVSRAIQGVLTGIGFVGAGVIVHDASRRVYGLTTAAAIWLTALFGVACGVGAYSEALFAVALAFVVIVVGGPIESFMDRRFGPSGGFASDSAPPGSE